MEEAHPGTRVSPRVTLAYRPPLNNSCRFVSYTLILVLDAKRSHIFSLWASQSTQPLPSNPRNIQNKQLHLVGLRHRGGPRSPFKIMLR